MSIVTRVNTAVLATVLGLSSHATLAAAPTRADQVAGFTSGIGINTHLPWPASPYYPFTRAASGRLVFSPGKLRVVENALAYIGIHNVRDYFGDSTIQQTTPATSTQPALSVWEMVHRDIGVKFDFPLQNTTGQVSEAIRLAGVAKSFEGPNEVDSWTGFTYVTPSGQRLSGKAAGVAAQPVFWNKLNSTARTAGIPLLQFSLGMYSSFSQIGGRDGRYADYGNAHIYYGTGNPPGWNHAIPDGLAVASIVSPGKPIAITETGYATMPHDRRKMGVSQRTQARYILNNLLDDWQYGARISYLYELADDHSDPGNTEYNYHFGVYTTNWTPKPAAAALHNFMGLLADNTTQRSGYSTSLTYSIGVSPSQIRFKSHLFQKRDGTFILALWNDARLANTVNQADIVVAPIPVSINFASTMARVQHGDSLVAPVPTSTSWNVRNMTAYVPDHPIFLFITP